MLYGVETNTDAGVDGQLVAESETVRRTCQQRRPYVIMWVMPQGLVDSMSASWGALERELFTEALDLMGALWIFRRDGEKGYEWGFSTGDEGTRALLSLLIAGYLNPRGCRCRERQVEDDPVAIAESKRRHPAFAHHIS